MAQTKKKTSTKTAKKPAARGCCKKCCARTTKKQELSRADKIHVYIITAMAMVAGILLCANAAMMIV